MEELYVTGGSLNDTLIGSTGSDLFTGNGGDDSLSGEAGNDILVGGAGNDIINGGAGADQMSGGDGDDTYTVDTIEDLVEEAASAGVDTVRSTITLSLAENVENLVLTGFDPISGYGNALNNVITGNFSANSLYGSDGNDTLEGSWSDDTLDGGAGADTLDGGPDADAMTGGTGDDIYIVDNAADTVNENVGEGVDSVQSGVTFALGANVENLTLTGFASINGAGNALANTITGNGSANTLSGGGGIDTINGGAGDDTINWAWGDGNDVVDGGADNDTLNLTDGASGNILNVAYNGGALTNLAGMTLSNIENVNANMGNGIDWLLYSASTAVTVNLTLGTASGFTSIAGVERVIGGSGNDTLTGNNLDNRLDGGAGDDTLAGGGGIDTLIGGDGADAIAGGLSNDSIQAGAGNDTISWSVGDGRDTIDGGADFDTFNAAGSASADLGNATWNGSSLTALMDNGLSNLEAINLDLGGGVDWLIYNATAAVVVTLATNSASGFASISNIESLAARAMTH